MTDMLYEKQGSYLQGKDDERNELAEIMLTENEPIEKIMTYSHLTEKRILEIKAKLNLKS